MASQPKVADRVLDMLRSLADITDGFAVDQLTHCLQTATKAERDGASDEVVIASACHDIGKAVSTPNHGAIAAEMLKPYVSDDVYGLIRVHQDFQGKHYYHHFDGDPDAREQYRGESYFDLTAQFADDWDHDLRPGLRHAAPRALRGASSGPVRHAEVALRRLSAPHVPPHRASDYRRGG